MFLTCYFELKLRDTPQRYLSGSRHYQTPAKSIVNYHSIDVKIEDPYWCGWLEQVSPARQQQQLQPGPGKQHQQLPAERPARARPRLLLGGAATKKHGRAASCCGARPRGEISTAAPTTDYSNQQQC